VSPAPAREVSPDVLDVLFAARPILTPNEGEAQALARVGTVEEAARALTARTGAPVVATLGEGGAILAIDGALERLPAHPVRVADTTGAGDTFTGALAAELARGVELREAVRYALAAASLSVTVAGARGGSPTREGVASFLGEQTRR
jgi:ribokinase